MARVFLDSTILIDYLNRIAPARTFILAHPKAAISVVAWMEVMVGEVNTPNEKIARAFLDQFQKIGVTARIQERAVHVRKRTRLKLPDAIIYATAEEHDAVLVTRNDKDFPASDPRIHVPYQL